MTTDIQIFLDDGGVINDNSKRGPQWQKLVGEWFMPKFGGTADEWKNANIKAVEYEIRSMEEITSVETNFDYLEYLEQQKVSWIKMMFSEIGISIPDDDECISLAKESGSWIIPQVKSAYPGIIQVIKDLSKRFTLNTASNEDSVSLDLTLSGMGIRENFNVLCGPDLIGSTKYSERYYRDLFNLVNINPKDAIVVDDKRKFLAKAKKLEASVIHSCLDPGMSSNEEYSFTDTRDLLKIISEITQI